MNPRLHPTSCSWLIRLATVALGGALVAWLAGCGAAQTATSLAPTVGAAATTAATNIPAGAGATAANAATQVAPNVPPGAGSTAAAVATTAAPTVNAAAAAAVTTATALVGSAGTPGPQATVTGQVTKADPTAQTFTVQSADGKTYDFAVTTGTQVDFAALASDIVSKQQVTVTYRNTTAPYEVVSVR